jgi:NAD-dependent SIR2 family protein deacetylase
MNHKEFEISVENGHLRSKRLLLRKGVEYAKEGEDRLEQFYRLGALNEEAPTESLWGMASKQVSSIATMVKSPTSYNLKKWREKITDLRNYTHLLDALLEDLGVE